MIPDRAMKLDPAGVAAIPTVTSSEPPPVPPLSGGIPVQPGATYQPVLVRDSITIPREVAQRVFDVAVGADQTCSGYMDTDDVRAMRHLAEALGVDPAVCTCAEFTTQFPHAYVPGHPDIGEYRQRLTLSRGDVGSARSVSVHRDETDAEVLARLGGAIAEVCMAGRWRGRCGKPAGDPIHSDQMGA